MSKYYIILILGLLLSNCSNQDDIGCDIFDPATPFLAIKLVDSNGINLIENGTIDPTEITLQSGLGLRFLPPNDIADPNSPFAQFDNTIDLSIPDESTFQYMIDLNNTDVVSLDFTAERRDIECDITFYIPTKVMSDNQNLELREVSRLAFLVEIEL